MTSQKFIQILFVLVCLAVCQGTPWWHGGDWDDDKSSNTFDPCKMFCCANGGVCKLDSDMMPMCECSGSWNGTHCEANPCDGMTCQNDGTCLVNMADGTAQCCCTSGFTGANCANAVDACSFVQCQNSGNCSVNILGQAVCACPTGFGGQLCELDCSIPVPCPAGFQKLPPLSGRCYSICPVNSQSWLAAQVTCLGLAATLWEPNDAAEVLAVQGALDVNEKYWTGAFDGLAEGTTNFAGSGLPFPAALTIEDNTARKDCVEFNRETVAAGWKFRYRTCTVTTRKCICEIPSPCQATGPTIPIFPV